MVYSGSDEVKLLKLRIEQLIEYSPNPYAKAAFYQDSEVQQILEKLYDRWISAGYRGSPLDYASIDELRILAQKAELYKDAKASVILRQATGMDRIALSAQGYEDRKEEGIVDRIFKKLKDIIRGEEK